MGLSSYEEHRQKRVDENKKRLEELNLLHLSQSLKNLSPKPSPMKRSTPAKSRTVEKQMVAVRRSPRVASNPAPVYVEVGMSGLSSPRKNYGIGRGAGYGIGRGAVWNGKYATDEERANAIEKAEQLASKLEQDGFPTAIRPILPSHVSSGFWLSLPSYFCKPNLPSTETTLTLEDENGDEFPVVYLPGKCGLSGGWRGFAIYKELSDGDALVFQLTSPSVFKVHIIRVTDLEDEEISED
ncbi:B3 domain-containing protein Os06g0194400-like [Silene latifolia]|uniref:B3 domain-containing protein Os06g0194400-like n=1 Tax=Silene latifolia TaxID=37657 RepID=UPI003D78119F